MGFVVLIVRVALAAVFAIAGFAKLADREGGRKSMVDFGAPVFLANPLAWLVPLAELACAAALLWTPSVPWGAGGLLAMLIVFSAAMAIVLARGRRPDCHCFGQLNASPIGAKTLVRNAVLAAMAAFVWWQGPQAVDARELWSALSRFQSALPAMALVFAAILLFQQWTLIHMLRQNGRLLLRVEALEKGGKPGSEQPLRGLDVNQAAPGFSLPAVDGGAVTLEDLGKAGKPILLFFNEASCGPCNTMLPEVAGWQNKHADGLLIVPISRGDVEANRARNATHNLRHGLLQADREVEQAYLVTATPTAVMVADGRVASRLAEGVDQIRALVAQATMPPPLKQGETVHSLSLPDLDGRTVDLATLRGRRRLLLFWSPTCGFCQNMLADLKAWERNAPEDAPELLIISQGTPDANRQQGFRSRVLLDQSSGAGLMFSAGGTPSAVMLDEEGRLASPVGVGALEVMAMAGAVSAAQGRPA